MAPTLSGSPEEREKYRKIKKLRETISKALEWAPIEKVFSGMKCIKLAVQNCGKTIDEDVEIAFELPRESLVTLSEFPQLNNEEIEYLMNDCEMNVLFKISGTAEYIKYLESERNSRNHYSTCSYVIPGYVPDYSNDFIEALNDVFCYAIYSSEDKFIVKLKIEYIKHNTTVAFPTVLFVKKEIVEIPYRITSKNNPDVVEGNIKVQK